MEPGVYIAHGQVVIDGMVDDRHRRRDLPVGHDRAPVGQLQGSDDRQARDRSARVRRSSGRSRSATARASEPTRWSTSDVACDTTMVGVAGPFGYRHPRSIDHRELVARRRALFPLLFHHRPVGGRCEEPGLDRVAVACHAGVDRGAMQVQMIEDRARRPARRSGVRSRPPRPGRPFRAQPSSSRNAPSVPVGTT